MSAGVLTLETASTRNLSSMANGIITSSLVLLDCVACGSSDVADVVANVLLTILAPAGVSNISITPANSSGLLVMQYQVVL